MKKTKAWSHGKEWCGGSAGDLRGTEPVASEWTLNERRRSECREEAEEAAGKGTLRWCCGCSARVPLGPFPGCTRLRAFLLRGLRLFVGKPTSGCWDHFPFTWSTEVLGVLIPLTSD